MRSGWKIGNEACEEELAGCGVDDGRVAVRQQQTECLVRGSAHYCVAHARPLA